MSLKNKLALVTGAASGIGKEIASTFSREGATVIAIDINDKIYEAINDFDKSFNQNHSAFIVDVSKSDEVETLFEKISELYKDEKVPSIIVNCAGIFILSKLIDTTEETFDKIVSVNLKGPFLITRAAIKELVKHFPEAKLKPLESYASVINISSISAKSGFPGNQCVYAATKSGLDAMSTILGFELAEYKIRVNSVAPGPIRSPMNTANPQSKLHADMTYMKRLGEASEIAECCLFLASDRSSYITGYCLDCGGGWY